MSTTSRGRTGEDQAVEYLIARGYKILERNFRSARGEVDIIAETSENIVFVEVKRWRSISIEGLEHSIGPRKQHRLISTARYYLSTQDHSILRGIRFDVIFISPGSSKLYHLEGAFEASCPE
jgi:putative endonuclease